MLLMSYLEAMAFVVAHPHQRVRRVAWKAKRQTVHFNPFYYTRYNPFRTGSEAGYYSKGEDRRGNDWYHCWAHTYYIKHPGPLQELYGAMDVVPPAGYLGYLPCEAYSYP